MDTLTDALERGCAEKSDWMYTVGMQPCFHPYHAHPRCRALLERVTLTLAVAPP